MQRLFFGVLSVLLVVGVVFSSNTVLAQSAHQTAWGHPDLQGLWDFRTITPMQLPEDLADQEFLSAEEAADLEQGVVNRNS